MPCSVRPLVIFGALLASRVSTIIVGCCVFSGSFRYGMSVSVPSMVVAPFRVFDVFLLEICVAH